MGIKHIRLEEGSLAEISEQGHTNPTGLDVLPERAAEALQRTWESTNSRLSRPYPHFPRAVPHLTSFSEELAERRTSQASKNSVWESARDRTLLWDSWGVSPRPFMYRASCCGKDKVSGRGPQP